MAGRGCMCVCVAAHRDEPGLCKGRVHVFVVMAVHGSKLDEPVADEDVSIPMCRPCGEIAERHPRARSVIELP